MPRYLQPHDVLPRFRGPALRGKLPTRHLYTVPDEEGEWYAALQSMFATPPGALMLLLGKRGTGKTQLGVEYAKRLIQQTVRRDGEAELPVYYTAAASLFSLLRASGDDPRTPSEVTTMRMVQSVPLLIIDEIQERKNSDWEDRTLVNIVDARYGAMLTTILIGNITVENAETSLGASIVDRLVECGAVMDCQGDSSRG